MEVNYKLWHSFNGYVTIRIFLKHHKTKQKPITFTSTPSLTPRVLRHKMASVCTSPDWIDGDNSQEQLWQSKPNWEAASLVAVQLFHRCQATSLCRSVHRNIQFIYTFYTGGLIFIIAQGLAKSYSGPGHRAEALLYRTHVPKSISANREFKKGNSYTRGKICFGFWGSLLEWNMTYL
jgi:hypothetical protein